MNDNKKIAFNSVIIFVRLIVTSIVGLFSSRLVLDALGASDYGLYSVVGGLVVLLNVLNTAMITTTYRFIAFELGKKQEGNPKKIFNASFLIHLSFALFILTLGLAIGLYYVYHFLNVPSGKVEVAAFVLTISVITTSISTILVPYQGLLVAFEKFYVSAVIDIVTRVLYLIAIYYFLTICHNGIITYSYIQLGLAIVTGASFYFYSRLHYNSIVTFRFVFDRALIKEMFSFTGWILFGATASVIKTQGTVAVINYFFGTLLNAAFAVANQVQSFILMFSRNIAQAAIPQITKNLSGRNEERSIRITCYVSKYTFILMMLVAFPVVLELDFLLGLWLKDVPDYTSGICVLLITDATIECLGAGIPALVQATGKIKYFQIICSLIPLIPFPIAIIFFAKGYNVYTILIFFIIADFINAIVRLYLLKRILKFDVLAFMKISYFRIFAIIIPLVLFYIFYNPIHFSLLGHIAGGFCSELYLWIVIALFGLDGVEKTKIKNILNKNIIKNNAN